jgi:aminoglycoside 3-N-acetyltransferase
MIATNAVIARGLRVLGVEAGDIVCVHSSMKSLDLVIGGPRAVVEALVVAVSPGGTVMMPTYSGDLSDPAEWRYPPVPSDQQDEIRAQMPAYDPARTPTRGLGQVAEYFRTYPDVARSPHPQSSFAALGARARELVSDHPYDNRFGPQSPLGRLCDAGGKVLLLGAPYNTVSLFHMIQHLVGESAVVQKAAPVIDRGERRWVTYSDIDYPIDWFNAGVTALIEAGIATAGQVSAAHSVLFPAADAVTFLVDWRHEHGFVPSIAGPEHTDRNN